MLWWQLSSCQLWSSDANFVYFLAVLPFLLCSAKNVKEVADKSRQVDFTETMEMENGNGNTETGNTESTAHACSQVPSCTDLTCDAAIGHVFFEVYLSALVLSGTWLPQFPDTSVYNPTLHIFPHQRYVRWSCVLNCFMLSSLPCFYAFCWSAIHTSCYIFNVFYSCSCHFF